MNVPLELGWGPEIHGSHLIFLAIVILQKKLKHQGPSSRWHYLFLKTRRSVEHCTLHPMAPHYISLAYLIYFRMIKIYLIPICWQCGRGSISLQSPVAYQVIVSFPDTAFTKVRIWPTSPEILGFLTWLARSSHVIINIFTIVGGVWSWKEGWVRGSSLYHGYSACSVAVWC